MWLKRKNILACVQQSQSYCSHLIVQIYESRCEVFMLRVRACKILFFSGLALYVLSLSLSLSPPNGRHYSLSVLLQLSLINNSVATNRHPVKCFLTSTYISAQEWKREGTKPTG